MKHRIIFAYWMMIFTVAGLTIRAQDEKAGSVPDRSALEKKFADTLTKSQFVGRWCLVRDGKLGEEREDKYTIQSVTKIEGDKWLITARMQFGNVDVNVPVPVDVKWAGDTPVIQVTQLPIPGVGTYTARVVVYGNQYAGTWSGGDHGGLMNGIIVPQDQEAGDKE